MLAASFIVALVSSSSSSTSPVKSPLPRAGDPFPRIGDHRYRAVLDSRMITSDSTEQSTLPFAHSTIIPSSPMSSSSSTQPHLMLTDLLTTVEDTAHCGRVIIESHLHSLLNISLHRYQPQLLLLARIISNSRDPRTFELPANSSITIKPSFLRKNNFTSPKPIFALKLICDDALPPSWTPLLIYPLKYSPNSFLLITTSPLTLDACSMSECSSKSFASEMHLRTDSENSCSLQRLTNNNLFSSVNYYKPDHLLRLLSSKPGKKREFTQREIYVRNVEIRWEYFAICAPTAEHIKITTDI
ncbi:hypothetical protein AB6A40_007260 [Gnathostoma spinigerum]|uniref:Uncharacterized protein n=1 Tax=Gnathostoma spinigerum TaxID=75299 RepID=A0ABD6EMP4_9BILA